MFVWIDDDAERVPTCIEEYLRCSPTSARDGVQSRVVIKVHLQWRREGRAFDIRIGGCVRWYSHNPISTLSDGQLGSVRWMIACQF